MDTETDGRRVAVIGAGPAGAAAAYCLAKRGVEVHLYEASPHIGGMARSIELWGQTVDIGPHRFFSSDPRVNKLWLQVMGRDYEMVDRLTRVFFRNRFFYYPIKAGDALKNLGLVEGVRCVGSYAWQKVKPGRGDLGDTFESWVTERFGRRLYQHFFETYTEKLWGIPCNELDSEFAAQRIKKLSLWEALKSAVLGGGGKEHRTLVDEFAYPKAGTGDVYRRMAAAIEAGGSTVHRSTPVSAVVNDGMVARGLRLQSGEVREYDEIVSSMPLTLLVASLEDVPDDVQAATRSLKFRNTLIVYLQIDESDLFPDNWIYVHSADLRTGRITNFRNWVSSINQGRPETILAMEYWCFDEDDFWHWDEERHIQLAKQEIVHTGLVREDQILDGRVVRVPRCYPVYQRGYREPLHMVEDYLRKFEHLHVIGRYGAFKYNNQDHSILMGLLASENILDGAGHDLWEINSDYEYQESSRITETGLVGAD